MNLKKKTREIEGNGGKGSREGKGGWNRPKHIIFIYRILNNKIMVQEKILGNEFKKLSIISLCIINTYD